MKYLLISFILFLNFNLFGQKVISQFPLSRIGSIRRVSCHPIGAYNLLNYQQLVDNVWHSFYYVLSPSGSFREINFDKDEFDSIIGIVPIDDNSQMIYYAFQNNKKLLLRGLELNLSTLEKKTSSKSFEITGKVIGSQVENNNIILYSIDRINGSDLTITKIVNDDVSESHYSLPIDLNSYKESDVAFISKSNYVPIGQALEKIKITCVNGFFDIVIDNSIGPGKKNTGTLLIHLDIASKAATTTFIEEPKTEDLVKYRSYLCGKNLYRALLKRNSLTLKVFDSNNGELTFSKVIEKKGEFSSRSVYLRERGNISINNVVSLMEYPDRLDPFIVVNIDSTSGKNIVAWGTNQNRNAILGPIGLNPAAILASLITNTIFQLQNPGISSYFYLSGSPDKDFKVHFEDPLNGIRQKIDSFEITKVNNKSRYENLAYSYYEKGVLGVYYDYVDKRVILLSF